MSKTMITLLSMIVLSVAAYLVMIQLFEWTQKKAAIIAFGAAGAMILFDVVLLGLKNKRTE